MGSEPDHSWRLLCAGTLLEHLIDMGGNLEGAKSAKDKEQVHLMRVSSRRIRAAMRIFEDCLPPKRFKTWRKEVRKVTRVLGEARDADVQIELLNKLKATAGKGNAPGLGVLIALKKKKRAALQGPLVAALVEMQRRNSMSEMKNFFSTMRQVELKEWPTEVRSPSNFMRASESVRDGIEGLVLHETYVHREDAVSEHHALRIAAKRLRYTIEIFRLLFDDELRRELAWMKRLQELLGSLHDCDIWIEGTRDMIETLEKGKLTLPKGISPHRLGPGLVFLEQNRLRERRRVYRQFVLFWDRLAKEGWLESLQRRMDSTPVQSPDLTPNAIKTLVTNPETKIAVLGDVHGNLHALRAVLRDARSRGAEVVLNTGDFLGYGAGPEDVVHVLRSLPSVNVIGNYDLESLQVDKKRKVSKKGKVKDKMTAFLWANQNISLSSREWLLSLPKEVRVEVGEKRLLLLHGSPDSIEEHLGPDTSEERLKEIAAHADADVIISGHSHQAMSRMAGRVRFINPGSVGRQDDGDPRASYAVLRLRPFRVHLHRVPYDVEAAAKAVRKADLPEAFAQMLIRGRSYDIVTGRTEEDALAVDGDEDKALMVSRHYLGEDSHSDQVARLSKQLFDCLKNTMGLRKEDADRLRSASILHDIGWVEGRKGHHKNSLRMILEEDALGMDRPEREVVGNIARYHRKALPSEDHAHYSGLGRRDKRVVERLSAILRVADALDFMHDGKVRSLRCELTPHKIIIRCSARGSLEMEKREALEKGDLLRKVLNRDLELLWDVT